MDTTHALVIDCNKIVVHDPSPKKNFQGVDLNGSDELVQFYCFDKIPESEERLKYKK